MKQNILIATLLAAMLALAGCGGGSSNVVNTAAQIKVDINACTTLQCVDAELAKASDADKADLMATADAKKKALAGMNNNEPKSVKLPANDGPSGLGLTDSGDSEEITIEAGKSRTLANVVFSCSEAGGDCVATFKNELNSLVVMSTGELTATPKPAANKGTISDSTATVSGTAGTANSGPVMLVREERDWNGNGNKTTSWGIVVKSGTKEAAATFTANNQNTVALATGWQEATSDETAETEDLIAFSAATNAESDTNPLPGTTGTENTRLKDQAYMTLGAWVIYPNPTLSSTGKVAYASKELGSKGMTLLGQYKTAKTSATYNGAAVGVTVSAAVTDNVPKYTYVPWNGSSTLKADFDTMKISGTIDPDGTAGTAITGTENNIPLSAIDIGSNYKASGSITKGGVRDPKNHGTWRAEFVNEGNGVIGEFDYRTSADFGKKSSAMPLGNGQADPGVVTNARHYGAFGATNQ